MIRINLVRGKRKKRKELNVGSAWLALPLQLQPAGFAVVWACAFNFVLRHRVSGDGFPSPPGWPTDVWRHRADQPVFLNR